MNSITGDTNGSASLWRDGQLLRLLIIAFATFTSFGLTLAALPHWAAVGGAGVALVGLVTAAMLAATVAVQVSVPLLTMRIRGEILLGVGLLMLGLPAPLYALTTDVGWLVAISVVRGAGFGILTVLGASIAVSIAPMERRGQVVGLYGMAIAIPTMVAVPVGLAWTLVGDFSWVAVGAVAPALVVWLVGGMRPAFARAPAMKLSAPGAAPNGRDAIAALRPSLVMFAVTFAGAGYLTFLPLVESNGDQVIHAIWIFSIAGAIARLGAGFLADRLGSRHLLLGSALLTGVGLVAVCIDVMQTELGPLGLTGAVVFGFGYGAVQNLSLLDAVERTTNHEVASSVWNIGFDAGTGTGAWVVGIIAASSLGVSGGLGAAAIGIFVSVCFLRTRAQPALETDGPELTG